MAETGNTITNPCATTSAAQKAIDPLESVMAKLNNLEKDLAETKAELSQLKQQTVSDVAFTVNLSKHLEHLGSGQTIKFDNVVTNIESGYNPVTGVFTCPIDGNYVFIVTIMCHYGTFNELRLMMNGSSKMLIYTGNNELHNQGTNSVVLQLKKSDTVWIETSGYPSQSSVYGQHWSSFTGIKLK